MCALDARMKQWLTDARIRLEHRRRGLLRDRESGPEVGIVLARSGLPDRAAPPNGRAESIVPLLAIRPLAKPSAVQGRELSDVIAALCRLAGGAYGRCTACDEAIARERLVASPEAPRCFRCETGWAADAHAAALRGPSARLATRS